MKRREIFGVSTAVLIPAAMFGAVYFFGKWQRHQEKQRLVDLCEGHPKPVFGPAAADGSRAIKCPPGTAYYANCCLPSAQVDKLTRGRIY